MKTFIISSLLILALAASGFSKPINEIYSIKDPDAGEEAYVDDIPFNTWQIAKQSIINNLKVQEDEANVNDIQFNTEYIMYECLLSRMVAIYKMEENVRDIPFLIEYCDRKQSFSF